MESPGIAQDPAAELWAAYWQTRQAAERNDLAEHYLPLVRKVAAAVLRRLPRSIQFEELLSAGSEALLDLIPAFDPARGTRFESFAYSRLRFRLIDELRVLDRMPRRIRSLATAIEQGRARAEQELGRAPQPFEIAAAMGISEEEFCELERNAAASAERSIDVDFDAGGEHPQADGPADQKAIDPAIAAQRKDLLRLVSCGCTRTERLTLILRYYEGLTLREIAGMLGFSESHILEIHSALLKFLRWRLQNRRDEFDGGGGG